jgi:chromosome segregation ATPase
MLKALVRWFRRGARIQELKAEKAVLKAELNNLKLDRDSLMRRILSLQDELSMLRERLQQSYREQLDKMFEDLRRSGSDK